MNQDKPQIMLKQGQQIAIGVTLPDGTRLPAQPATVARVDEKSAVLELRDGGRVEILT